MLKSTDEGLTVAEVLEPLGWRLSEDHATWIYSGPNETTSIPAGRIEGLLRAAGKQAVIRYAQQEAQRCR